MESPQAWKAFTDFMAGFVAARELHARAGNAGSFVECVCLGASLVDALLRIGLVLQYQLHNRTRNIPLDLVFQGPSDQSASEREIYKRAQAWHVIDDHIFEELQRPTMIAIVLSIGTSSAALRHRTSSTSQSDTKEWFKP